MDEHGRGSAAAGGRGQRRPGDTHPDAALLMEKLHEKHWVEEDMGIDAAGTWLEDPRALASGCLHSFDDGGFKIQDNMSPTLLLEHQERHCKLLVSGNSPPDGQGG